MLFCFPAAQFVKLRLPDLLRSYVDADLGASQEGGFQDIAIEVLHLLLSHLLFGQKGNSGVGQEQIDVFLKTLCRGEELTSLNFIPKGAWSLVIPLKDGVKQAWGTLRTRMQWYTICC